MASEVSEAIHPFSSKSFLILRIGASTKASSAFISRNYNPILYVELKPFAAGIQGIQCLERTNFPFSTMEFIIVIKCKLHY
jgi:hypothetical protein